jgi:glutathione S-transferase
MSTMLLGYYRTAPEKRDAAALEAARKRAVELWLMVERQLEGGAYMAGAGFTLADITLGIFGHRWHLYPIERPSLPRLKAWYERIAARPGFVRHVAGPVS